MKRRYGKDEKNPGRVWAAAAVTAAAVLCSILFLRVGLSLLAGPPDLADVKTPAKGDLVLFGSFEQDAENGNGPEPICWSVMDAENDRVLLLCRDVLLAAPFHETRENITWKDCTLRSFLNTDFLETAFTKEEREKILLSRLDTPPNPRFSTKGSGQTEDRVFLLSLQEASAYMGTAQAREWTGSAAATPYAVLKHLQTGEEGTDTAGKANWWLRTAGAEQYAAAFVDRDGSIYESGADVSHETFCGIRPAVWVRISSG